MQIKSKDAVLFHIVYVVVLFILTFALYRYSILTIGERHSVNVATSISHCIEYRLENNSNSNVYSIVEQCVQTYSNNTKLEIIDANTNKIIYQSNNFKHVDFEKVQDDLDFEYTILTGDLIIYKFIPDKYKQFKHSVIKQMIIAIEHNIPSNIRLLYALLFMLYLLIIFKLVKDYERITACNKQ